MSVLYIHLCWFLFFTFTFLLFLVFSVYVSFMDLSFHVSLDLFNLWLYQIKLSLFFDYISLWFSTVILLISSVIIVYSYNYIMPYSNSIYFLWLTFMFVFSMICVVLFSDIVFVMLGWDGLGLISFFLIVYYQNQSSITSGLFTLIINRVGDSFFLITIVLFFYYSSSGFVFTSFNPESLVVFFLIVTFITNSAIFPFSPWLPIAIAAPTPISALVHSSTLVTSGLYLIIRYSFYIYSSFNLVNILFLVSIFTSFYAGLNSIFEIDFNNLIALSTLSHLGFIGLSFSLGLLHLAFFHLLTHALFKSLLFISIGDIIINLNHSQDSRYLSSGYVFTPFSCFIMNISISNLLGLPNVSGYFSKDLILESLNFSNVSFLFYGVMVINIFFTYFYSFNLFIFSFQTININPYQQFHYPLILHSTLLLVLSLFTIFFGKFFLMNIFYTELYFSIPYSLKFLPLFINMLVFIFLYLFLILPYFNSSFYFYFFSNMLFLTNFCMGFFSKLYYTYLFNLVNSFEVGYLNYLFNSSFSSSFVLTSNILTKFVFKFSSFITLMLFFTSISFILFF